MNITRIEQSKFRKPTAQRIRVYFSPTGEGMWANFINRTSRPYTEYRKLLPKAYLELGLSLSTRASWSQRAGCRCGCSPGFVLDTYGHNDVFVTVEGGDAAVGNEAERVYRAEVAQAIAEGKA